MKFLWNMPFAFFAIILSMGMTVMAQTQGTTGNQSSTDSKIGFDLLGGFPFEPPAYDPAKPNDPVEPRVDEQIPSAVRKCDNTMVTITGFMLPTRMENGRVLEFLLLRDQTMCCFGAQPQMNEWIVVRMDKPGTYVPDIPKTFSGRLRVGAVLENGYLSGIYLLENAKVSK